VENNYNSAKLLVYTYK